MIRLTEHILLFLPKSLVSEKKYEAVSADRFSFTQNWRVYA